MPVLGRPVTAGHERIVSEISAFPTGSAWLPIRPRA